MHFSKDSDIRQNQLVTSMVKLIKHLTTINRYICSIYVHRYSYMIRSIIIKLNKLHSSYHFSHLQHFCFFFCCCRNCGKELKQIFWLKTSDKIAAINCCYTMNVRTFQFIWPIRVCCCCCKTMLLTSKAAKNVNN